MTQRQTTNELPDLRLRFAGRRASRSLLEIEAWMPSEIEAISPLVDRLMRLIEGSHCVAGNERAVELALREASSNAVVHGNGMDAHKLVQIRCRCELGKGPARNPRTELRSNSESAYRKAANRIERGASVVGTRANPFGRREG